MSFDWQRQRTAVSRRPMYLQFKDATRSEILEARAVPATMNYDVWFWTKDYDKLQKVTEEYMWWQHEDPNLNINYNDLYPMEMDLHFGEPMDESTTDTMFDQGLYFVLHVPIVVDAWIIKGYEEKTIKKVIISIYDETIPTQPQLLEQETLILPLPPSGEEI